MAYTKEAADALSNNWRVFCLSLDNETREQMVDSMLAATSVSNERNVRLWFSTSSTYRKILNRTLSADEYKRREMIVKSCLRLNNENVPLKSTQGKSSARLNADRFGQYMLDKYTGRYTRIIQFTPTGFALFYDTYGRDDDEIDDSPDEAFIEYTDEPLPDEIIQDFF